MILDPAPYLEMKASEVPWLGQVPGSWRVLPGRACFRERKISNIGLKETRVLSLSFGRIVIKPPSRLHGLVPASFETYQVIDPGDIIIRPTDLQNDWNSLRVGLSRDRGIITSAYLCFETLDEVVREYGYWLLHAYDLMKVFYGLGSGLRQNLDWDDFKYLPCLAPPPADQVAIARFLSDADRRIRRSIGARQKLIELLNEQKRALTHRAVTCGFDPGVRMKPSGFEWLGDVPEHWEVLPLKRRWNVTDCKHLTVPFVDDGVPLASIREVQSFDLSLANAKRTTDESHKMLIEGGREPQRGDLIYSRNVSVGAAAVVMTDEAFAMGQDVCLIRSPDQNQRYLNHFLRSPAMDWQLSMLLVGSTFNRINVQEIKNLTIVVPPPAEQTVIAHQLDEDLARHDLGVEKARAQIELLREYRTCLVAAVVTGALDVRAAAARLNDTGDEDELYDRAETEQDDHTPLGPELEQVEA